MTYFPAGILKTHENGEENSSLKSACMRGTRKKENAWQAGENKRRQPMQLKRCGVSCCAASLARRQGAHFVSLGAEKTNVPVKN